MGRAFAFLEFIMSLIKDKCVIHVVNKHHFIKSSRHTFRINGVLLNHNKSWLVSYFMQSMLAIGY